MTSARSRFDIPSHVRADLEEASAPAEGVHGMIVLAPRRIGSFRSCRRGRIELLSRLPEPDSFWRVSGVGSISSSYRPNRGHLCDRVRLFEGVIAFLRSEDALTRQQRRDPRGGILCSYVPRRIRPSLRVEDVAARDGANEKAVGPAPIRGCAGERIRAVDGVQGQLFVCAVSISGIANDQHTPRGDDPG